MQILYDYGRELIEKIPEIKWQGKDIGISCSIGISAAASDKMSYQELYKKADDALYQAKLSGKKQILSYNVGALEPREEADTVVR